MNATDAPMAHVLRQIAFTAGDASSALRERSSATVKLHPSRLLSFAERPPHEVLLESYNRCRTDAGRAAVLAEAEGVLRRLRYSSKPKLDLDTEDGRLELGRDTRPAQVIADQYGYSVDHVRRIRTQVRRLDEIRAAAIERQRYDGTLEMRLRILAEPGSSYAVSARYLNVSPATVQRWRNENASLELSLD